MIPDIDIWRCAVVMIKHYGDTADIEAAARADEHLAKGEFGWAARVDADTEGDR
jgi:hypothetical protein